MDGVFDFAWKIFLFIMLVTSWRELTKIGISVISKLGGLISDIVDAIANRLAWFKSNRGG